MRTIIAGSRSLTDVAEVEAAVRECGWWPTVVLSGRAPGADMLGEAWAGAYGIGVEPYPADWAAEPRTAGHTRNTLMAERADALVALWDGSSPGTRDMIGKAQARGLRVHVRRVAGVAVPPPPPVTLLAGTRVAAGLTHSTVVPDLDFETYSEAGHVWDATRERWTPPPGAKTKGLGVVGAAVYSEHPTCEVLCLHYDLKDGKGRRGWRPGMPPPADLFDHIARGGLLEAWNVGFERWIWRNVCVPRMGWPAVRPEQWRCAMAKSRAHAGPGKLEVFGEVFALTVRKDPDGKRLLDKFSVPRNPTKADPSLRTAPIWDQGPALHALYHTTGWNFKETGPRLDRKVASAIQAAERQIAETHADTLRLYSYNETDIESEAEASQRTPDLSDDELAYWQDDQAINVRGVRIDLAGVEDCIAIIEQALKRYGDELEALAGCQPSELQQLKGWLHAQGVHLDSMDEDAVETALKGPLPDQARRALEIRAAVGSASVKKVYAMRNSATLAGRLHDLYTYHGARTGRCSGNGPQPTNLPKAGPLSYLCDACGHSHGAHTMRCPWCGTAALRGPKDAREWNPDAADDALIAIRSRSLDFVQWVWGDAMHAMAGVLRGLFVASEGHDFVSSDFTAIEGVVIAALAGEQWRVDAYANDEPMYLLSAERMFGVSVAEMKAYAKANGQHHPLRQKGKGGELACLAAETEVLTDRGYVRIVDVTLDDQLWDGIEWIRHKGLVSRGRRSVVALDGIEMTPEHLCLLNGSWREARQLASSASMLSRALATGSENLSSWALRPASGTREFSSSALAGGTTLRLSPTCGAARLPDAANAQGPRLRPRERSEKATTTLSLTTRTESDCLTGWLLPSGGVIGPTMLSATTTAVEASKLPTSGGRTEVRFCATLSPCRVGTTRLSTWTGQTLTATMNLGTSGSSLAPRTKPTDERSETCSDESPNLKPVFDIAHAGPRNRFTVRTNSGHLIVHNCGFGGWITALRQFGVDGTDDELKDIVLKWRAASPAIEWFWGGQTKGAADGVRVNAGHVVHAPNRWDRAPEFFGLEGMAVCAVLAPGTEYPVLRLDGTHSGVTYLVRDDVLYCRVPSGGLITYHRPRLAPSPQDWRGLSLTYEGWNSNQKKGPTGWMRMPLYGGLAAENVTQKVARDKQMGAIRRCEAAGYQVVMHTYDEIVAEVPEGVGSVQQLEALMTRPDPWNVGWPIKAAGGWRAKRYRKG